MPVGPMPQRLVGRGARRAVASTTSEAPRTPGLWRWTTIGCRLARTLSNGASPPHGLGGPRTGVWTAASAAAGGGTGGEITWSEELRPPVAPPGADPLVGLG